VTSSSAAPPLLPLVENPDDPLVREQFDKLAAGSGILNLHRMMAHAPALMKASGDMALAFRHETKLPRAIAELAILRAAQVLDAPYVWARHVPLARDCGVTAQQMNALASWPDSTAFTPVQKAALGFAEKAVQRLPFDDSGAAAPLHGARDRRACDGRRVLCVDRDLRQSPGGARREGVNPPFNPIKIQHPAMRRGIG
jgi:alkylhydroperoxidase family enzyme